MVQGFQHKDGDPRGVCSVGYIIHLRKKPRVLQLGDRKENLKKKLEPLQRKKQEIERMKGSLKNFYCI